LGASVDIEDLRAQAAAAYDCDRGWSVVREAFPDATLPSP
jgi:hypothetical protein